MSEVESEGSSRHHSLAEIGRVLDHLSSLSGTWEGHRLYALAATVAFTGLRKMEALSLRTADVKVDDRLIQIVKRRRLKRPTAAAPVPMAEELAEVLRSWLPQTGCGWCFPNLSRSGPWTGGSAGYTPLDRLKAAGLAVDVDGLTFQSLRHSWATHAESAWGLSELVVQRILRHTRTRTQDHYRHADKANLVEAVKGIRFGDRQAA